MSRPSRIAIAAAAAVIAAAIGLCAQQPAAVVPIELEPRHHEVFRNGVVAVLDVRIPAGDVSLFHTHAHDNVSVRILTGPTRLDTLSETGTPQTPAVGRVVFNSATPPYTHRVANVGTSPLRIVDVEILSTAPARAVDRADDLAGHEAVIDNARVRATRVTLDAGATMPAHGHPRGWLTVEVRGQAPGAFVWHDAGSTEPPVTAGPEGLERVEIEIK